MIHNADGSLIGVMIEDVQVVCIYDLQCAGILDDSPDYSPEGIENFKTVCTFNKWHYYARPKEDYSTFEGIDQAKALGLQIVIVDNLS